MNVPVVRACYPHVASRQTEGEQSSRQGATDGRCDNRGGFNTVQVRRDTRSRCATSSQSQRVGKETISDLTMTCDKEQRTKALEEQRRGGLPVDRRGGLVLVPEDKRDGIVRRGRRDVAREERLVASDAGHAGDEICVGVKWAKRMGIGG